jgi:hypothetical protein
MDMSFLAVAVTVVAAGLECMIQLNGDYKYGTRRCVGACAPACEA